VAGAAPVAGNLKSRTRSRRRFGFSPAVFNLRNGWLGKRGRRWVNVYAGAPHKQPRLGTVYLFEIPITNGSLTGPSGYYSTPTRDGPLWITCVRGNTVYLRSRDQRYVFDLRKPRIKPLHDVHLLG
jgi:hypothetical protein